MRFWSKLTAPIRQKKLDADMTEEMRLHLDLQADQYIAAGMTPEEAHYAARREFGGVEQIKEQCRERRAGVWFGNVCRDIRFCARSLGRARGFSLAVILTLTLCIGANTTVFSVLYGLILRPLPFRDAGQLVEVYNSHVKAGETKKPTSVAQYLDFKAQADLFDGFALWGAWTFNIGEDSDLTRGIGMRVTADIFPLLGIQPLLGRFFTMEECSPGKDHVLVLTQSFWERSFGADPAAVGKVIRLGGDAFTIVGIAPRRLEEFNVDGILLKPFEWRPELAASGERAAYAAKMYARVRSRVPLSSALAQLTVLEKRFLDHDASPSLREFLDRSGQQIALGPVRAEQTKSVKTSLLLLQAGAAFVLLLGCVNVANLMLARANACQVELAVRQALGASRCALARQLFVEGLLLVLAGTAVGMALTWTSLRVINRYVAELVREVQPIALNGAVLGYTAIGVGVVAALVAALPIAKTWRTDLLSSIQDGARGASSGPGLRAASGLLVIIQVTLATMLLVGACLLIRSFANVVSVNPGFDLRHTIHGRVAFNASWAHHGTARAAANLIMDRMREIPGVEAISYSGTQPIDNRFHISSVRMRGSVLAKEDTLPNAKWLGVAPNFFQTMGIRIIEGRDFNQMDIENLSKVPRAFIVDRRFAEKYFPGRSAIGEKFDFGKIAGEEDSTIVGVTEVAKLSGQEDRDGIPFVFAAIAAGPGGGFSILLRTQRPFEQMVPLMREKLRSVDPALPLYGLYTLHTAFDGLTANRRGVMTLLMGFALIAVTLAAIGIYGMLAYDVTRRTREIGIRGAVGATRRQIITMILRQVVWKAGAGLALGLLGSFFLSHFMKNLLFEVEPTDPLTYLGVTVLLGCVALFASWLPAWRASRIDPIVALRCG